MSPEPGTLDGRLEPRELLGEGGMGEVHAAWDRSLQRAVAVKFVRGSDPRAAERLLLEARLQARVDHPHVVKVFEVGTLEGRPCIVFQLVRGSALDASASTLPLAVRVELVRQAAGGLHAAHLQGLVHRDVKPGNVLVEEGEDGTRTALVADFGLAHAEEGGLTRSGIIPGTLDFMAPEQIAGRGPVDFRADVYALGATLYAVLAGQPPFRLSAPRQGDDEGGQVRLMRRILDEEPPPLRIVAPEAPRELAIVAAKAMEKDPAARYATAEAFAEDLGRFQRGEPIRARPATLGERAVKWARRNRAASRAIAAAAAALAAAGAFSLWLSRQAGVEALEAARLGAVASSLESRMRMEYLSPPHDLRPALAAVKAEVEGLRPLAARRGGGPASFALGKGLELTGDLDGARAAYERAWGLGFRTSEVARGLGTVLGHLYEREFARAKESLTASALAARVAELQAELRDPARLYLEQGDATGWRGPFLRGQIALLEGDFASARARAAEALRADPVRYEAGMIEGRSWVLEGKELLDNQRMDEAIATTERAVPPLEAAAGSGRSDPALLALLAEAHASAALALASRGRDPGAEADAALSWIERASALNPDSASLALERARSLEAKGMYALATRPAETFPLLERAAAFYRRASALDPRWLRPRSKLAYNAYVRSAGLARRGLPRRPQVEEGLRAVGEALALSPKDDEVVFLALLLRSAEADVLREEGRDPSPALRAAIGHGEDLIRPERGDLVQRLKKANASFRGLVPVGEDHPALAVIEQLLAAADGFGASEEYLGLRAMVPLVAASWALEQGRAPGAHLARAERGFERILGKDPGSVEGHAGLAACALVAARWAIAQRESPAAAARDGLAHAARAIEADPRDARAWILQARLQALDADRAAARGSLDRAYALQPLSRGSYEAKAAEAELGR